MDAGKILVFGVLMCIALIASTIEVNPADAGGDKPIQRVYGPDTYGVACYRDARNYYGDPISCVKVE